MDDKSTVTSPGTLELSVSTWLGFPLASEISMKVTCADSGDFPKSNFLLILFPSSLLARMTT